MNEKEKKLLGVERCVLLQALAESYLLRTKGKHFNEEYPDIKEEYGVLVDEHVKLLKLYLRDEFNARQLDLDACIEKSGETAAENKLTNYETSCLIRTADNVLVAYYIVEQRKKRLLNK